VNPLSAFLRTLTAPFRWLLKIPLGLFSAPRRLLGLSLPVRVAVITGIFLLLFAIAMVLISWWKTTNRGDWLHWLLRWELYAAAALIVVIPLLVYSALRLWLEGDVSRYPDIDEAWQAGLAALRTKRLEIDAVPLFLVLGAGTSRSSTALMEASGFEFLVSSVPEGHASLYWYAHNDAVYVVCNDIGMLGHLNAAVARHDPNPSPTAPAAHNIRGTIVPQRASAGQGRAEAPPSFGGHVGGLGGSSIKGTLVPGGGGGAAGAATAAPSSDVTKREAKEQASRLDYLCELLIRARQPLCPINGVLTLLPLGLLRSTLGARNLSSAVQDDLDTISERLRLRVPVTTLVTGMEAEPGFAELVRRVGVGQARSHRFGKGFDVWNAPSAENLDAFSLHACGAFEDWVYNLFLEPGAVDNPGNAALYTLLCTVRSDIRPRLRNVLIHGFSVDAVDRSTARPPSLFAGCYFAATGGAADEQAFVKSVFQKIEDLEEELEWHDDALRDDRRNRHIANVLVFLNGLLLLGIAGLVVYRFFLSGES
jgi:hypothetical protein